ncbi:ThiF family adenylyltransferase [Rhodoferax sp. BAB1]|uniref:HesA/MoeB/ThiF family protein n=1 Tax=Rhodoferax sp. BAB1 TaxID=2741720 RepID=UPI00157565A3|nr:ThiF family adenylyltransferase [Rhodoferax sp. BAB1]QKO20906.1 ThiF family adenylyltransferase [Rhodoferax sp. BAB1]
MHDEVVCHLVRADGQEDICFALWNPSKGEGRYSALIEKVLLPGEGDRILHGNVSFTPQFFERALAEAATHGMGLAMLHSHPLGRGWQDMSQPDVLAESRNAGAVYGATDLPFLGLTLACKDHAWSARIWQRAAPRVYDPAWCESIRVIGDQLRLHFAPHLLPPPQVSPKQRRTVSAWGEAKQADIARLRIGVIGAGSTGGFIAEGLARTGVKDILVMDPDKVAEHNLDRLVYAVPEDVGHSKVDVLAKRLLTVATAEQFNVTPVQAAVYEKNAYRLALDCDILFSCVDRPWGRHVLNHIAYAHLIPVVDGGILVRTNRSNRLVGADWTAQTVGVGRACLQCLGQYTSALVQIEREGMLDDPKYIEGLADDHPLKARQNVFGFSMACASLQLLQMLNLVVAPLDLADSGVQRYHFVDSTMEPKKQWHCLDNCFMPDLIAKGDRSPFVMTRE